MRTFNLEHLELRQYLSVAYRPIDEVGNNVANPTWGVAGTDLLRLAAAAYANGVSSPALPNDPSARLISNILNNQADPNNPSVDLATIDQNSLSDYGYAFGQFMDHDMDLTYDGGASFPITVPAGDPIGPADLPFTRSQTDPATGTSTSNPAQQVNAITSYLDLSQVYGSTQDVADALRTFQGGLLKTSPGNMLPYNNTTYFTPAQLTALNMANDAQAVPAGQLFAAGDRRANETLELTTLETLFVRNHNQIAGELAQANPGWSDEQLYQEARKINIAEYQNIIYTGWIPAVLGPKALAPYAGYDASVNSAIANEFSTVAYRFGHSLLSATIERQNNDGSDISTVNPNGSDISLAQDFFDPNLLNPNRAVDPLTDQTSSDIGPILKGMAGGDSQAMDTMAVADVRNLLFGNGGLGGQDLMARDVQRGRDNGIPDYNTLRQDLGLPAVTSFAQITSNVQVQQELAAAYPGGVNTIDAFEGGLAEDHVAGSDVGPLFQAIMVNQFDRLRDGDRFFYLNENFDPQEMAIFQQGDTLADVIKANSNITNLQSNVFVFKASISGTVDLSFGRGRFGGFDGFGMPGLTVQLLDANGDVLATTTTNGRGNYTFTQLSGQAANPDIGSGVSATGTYDVVLVLPSWLKQYGTDPASIDITRGGTAVRNIDFGVTLAGFGGFGGDVDPRGWNNSLDAGIDSSNWRDLPVGLDHLQTTLMDA